eukprot:14906686-Alexandrium_andersonii.AAC.1
MSASLVGSEMCIRDRQSHDVAAWLKWRDYSMAAKGGDDRSSRSTSSNKRKNRKGRKKGKSRSKTPDRKKGKANIAMDQGAADG